MTLLTLLTWGANSHGQLGLGWRSEQEVKAVSVICLPSHLPGQLKELVGGGGHSLLCDSAGRVYVTGWNNVGQLGLAHTDPVCVFTEINFPHFVTSLAAGWDFSLLLTQSGEVFACGSNSFGQLGVADSNIKSSNIFVKIKSLKNIRKISAGLRHAGCVDDEGSVYTWGAGTKGQLGNGKVSKQFEPVKISSISGALDVHCGQHFTVVETEQCVLGVGDNKYHQLGDSTEAISLTEPVTLSELQAGDQISCGWTHLVTCRAGTVTVSGRDNYSQRGGAGTVMEGVRKAVAGSEHCLCLSQDGSVWAWGWNEHGNCGTGNDPPPDSVTRPVRLDLDKAENIFVGSAHNFVLIEK